MGSWGFERYCSVNAGEMTDVFMMALSKSEPLRLRNPAEDLSGLSKGKMTRGSVVKSPSQFSPIVLPETVIASGWGSALFLINSAMTAEVCQLNSIRLCAVRERWGLPGRPPARWYSSHRYCPAGWMLTSNGSSYPTFSQSSQSSLTPMCLAIAFK